MVEGFYTPTALWQWGFSHAPGLLGELIFIPRSWPCHKGRKHVPRGEESLKEARFDAYWIFWVVYQSWFSEDWLGFVHDPRFPGGTNPSYCICGRLNEVFIAMLLYITYRLVNLACGHGWSVDPFRVKIISSWFDSEGLLRHFFFHLVRAQFHHLHLHFY